MTIDKRTGAIDEFRRDTARRLRKNETDAERTRWLESQGYTVLRFWNTEVFTNTDGVLEAIYGALYGSRDEAAQPLNHRRRRR